MCVNISELLLATWQDGHNMWMLMRRWWELNICSWQLKKMLLCSGITAIIQVYVCSDSYKVRKHACCSSSYSSSILLFCFILWHIWCYEKIAVVINHM